MAREVPTPTRIARRHGIISAAQVIGDDQRLEAVRWRPSVNLSEEAGRVEAWRAECATVYDKTPIGAPRWTFADPFVLIAGVECSPVGVTEAEFLQIATEQLEQHEESLIERVMHDGQLQGGADLEFRLQRAAAYDAGGYRVEATEVLGGGATGFLAGLGLLQDALADQYGGQGVLHSPRQVEPFFPDSVRLEGANLVTRLGNVLSFGAGYPNESPAGVAAGAGQAWLYATGPVVVRRSTVKPVGGYLESVDGLVNTVTRFVERTYTVGWDPAKAWAVLVDLPSEDGGGP